MKVKTQIVGGAMMQNCYFVIEECSSKSIIIDPGADFEMLDDIIQKDKINLEYIVLTHGHFDHIGACVQIKEKYNTPIVILKGEELLTQIPQNNLSEMINKQIIVNPDIKLEDDDYFKFGDNSKFKVIKTGGHTPSSMCLYFEDEKIIFTGDTLFQGSIGRTDFPYGNSNDLINSLQKLKILPNETLVYSGHGDKTTIGEEKRTNPYMKDKIKF